MLDRLSRAALYALLVWAPLASGAYRGVPLAVLTVLVALALAAAAGGMLAARRLEWRRTPLDLPPRPHVVDDEVVDGGVEEQEQE